MPIDPAIPDPDEAADSVAPSSLSYKADDARALAPYYLRDVNSRADLQARVQGILGFNLEGRDGRIIRSLPRSYGADRALCASSVSLVGYGVPEVLTALDLAGDEPPPPGEDALGNPLAAGLFVRTRPEPVAEDFAVYPEYTANVEFLQRPYALLPDDQIPLWDTKWYDEAGVERPYRYAEEWQRFCEVDEKFEAKIITATQGQLTFRTGDGSAPDGQAFAGTPRLPYPESVLTVTWRQVPYRYVSSRRSYLKRFANRVNQFPFSIQGYEFDPGELLYLGYDYKRYTPPFPLEDQALGRFVLEKWVDLTLTFGVARRRSAAPPDLPNPNWVPHNWNALPWFGPNFSGNRGFHYACSFHPMNPADRKFWQPIFLSGPVPELLFTDPDVAQPEGFV